ncbi:2'-5' RNA ligase family protein [Nocardia sp. NPDC052566]|uniref:2'-5' RNA ligase family protein n=1 Tax=Nocardia sp. NPDC052566 TaxID=3364330 RepID=UPI0037C97FD1
MGYYWLLTFEHAVELHALVKGCQQSIDPTYFDLTTADGLHLTLDRIAHDGEASHDLLDSIGAAARDACRRQPSFTLTIGHLTNLRGAIGFIASPHEMVHALRDRLRAATRSIYPDAPVKGSASNPHVTVAYPVFEGLAEKAAATAEKAGSTLERVDVTVTEVVMVALERHSRSYQWDVVSRIRLSG